MLTHEQLYYYDNELIEKEYSEPIFDFNSPEDVLVWYIKQDDPQICSVEHAVVWNVKEGVIGAASYEDGYGGFLNYTIEGLVDFPVDIEENFYIIEDVIGEYVKGDGWITDDNMYFYYKSLREATIEEIADYFECDFWQTIEECD